MLDNEPRKGNRIAFRLDANFRLVSVVALDSAQKATSLTPADVEARFREVMAE